MSKFQGKSQSVNFKGVNSMVSEWNRNSSVNDSEVLVSQNNSAYYEYLREMKNGDFNDTCDYAASFMTF
ncbi:MULTISPECIES: hypothetical protein [Clostridium]|uniref:Uncharacterized protein n=2 Tax=Clostridium TaxID=1485 RepID=A0A0E3M619_CLOSL|nr:MULTISPECIES: hypothetical protein [Clostridium]AKA68838.1 hypothetical protein CSCA_1713 [Clostridium scatologenes]AWI04947.1 hypothetical protein B9W14_10710 [Clostridium drakei]